MERLRSRKTRVNLARGTRRQLSYEQPDHDRLVNRSLSLSSNALFEILYLVITMRRQSNRRVRRDMYIRYYISMLPMPWLFSYSSSSAQSNASERYDSGWNLVDAPFCGGSTELEKVYAMLPRSGVKNHYRHRMR